MHPTFEITIEISNSVGQNSLNLQGLFDSLSKQMYGHSGRTSVLKVSVILAPVASVCHHKCLVTPPGHS